MTAVTVAATPPKVTVVPGLNPFPVMVTEVPPAPEPELGESEFITGI